MYSEATPHHEQEEPNEDTIADFDNRIEAARQELDQAESNLRDKAYPDNRDKRAKEYSKRLNARDEKKKALATLEYKKLEEQEKLEMSSNN